MNISPNDDMPQETVFVFVALLENQQTSIYDTTLSI